jgi:hypothetical protein
MQAPIPRWKVEELIALSEKRTATLITETVSKSILTYDAAINQPKHAENVKRLDSNHDILTSVEASMNKVVGGINTIKAVGFIISVGAGIAAIIHYVK